MTVKIKYLILVFFLVFVHGISIFAGQRDEDARCRDITFVMNIITMFISHFMIYCLFLLVLGFFRS